MSCDPSLWSMHLRVQLPKWTLLYPGSASVWCPAATGKDGWRSRDHWSVKFSSQGLECPSPIRKAFYIFLLFFGYNGHKQWEERGRRRLDEFEWNDFWMLVFWSLKNAMLRGRIDGSGFEGFWCRFERNLKLQHRSGVGVCKQAKRFRNYLDQTCHS